MWGEVNEEMKIRIQYNSPVVITFAFLSLFALLADEVSGGWTNQHIFSVYRAPLSDPLTYARAFLHVLGHTDWEHYSNNILLMLVIGPQLEEKYGSKTLLLCISVNALVTGLVQCLLFPNAALLGASGILFMMLLMASMGGMSSGTIPLTMILVAAFYLGGEIRTALAVRDSISRLTHVIGGVCSAALGFGLSE